jgi:hypothetical protein
MYGECGELFTYFLFVTMIFKKTINNVVDSAPLNNCLSQNCDLSLVYWVQTDMKLSFDVFLTVHLRIFISVFNQLDAQYLFYSKFYFMFFFNLK